MPDVGDIERARNAELEENATPIELTFLVLGRKGIAVAVEAGREAARRIRARVKLGLPHQGCIEGVEYCDCLTRTLDAALEAGGKATRGEILRAAKRKHAAWLASRPKPLPVPVTLEAVVVSGSVSAVVEDVREGPLPSKPEPEKPFSVSTEPRSGLTRRSPDQSSTASSELTKGARSAWHQNQDQHFPAIR